jgi:hypothetical protein
MAPGERRLFGPHPSTRCPGATRLTHGWHANKHGRSRFVRGTMGARRWHWATTSNPKGMSMAKQQSTAQWIELDPASLSDVAREAYAAYKATYKQMKTDREWFETCVSEAAELPEGKRLVFGYNFGKLSVAVVDDDRKAKPAAKSPQSLSAYLAGMQANGRRC